MTSATHTGWIVLDQSLDALQSVTSRVTAAQWTLPTPCREWTARQVLEHAAGDQLAWAATVGRASQPSYNPFAPSGHEDGSAADLLTEAVSAATVAWSELPSDVSSRPESVPTPLPQGALAPEIAAAACALDAAVHAWDIAMATGQPSPLSDELAGGLRAAAEATVEPLRQYGMYAAIVDGPASDGAAASLLRYLGRDPRWSAPTD